MFSHISLSDRISSDFLNDFVMHNLDIDFATHRKFNFD